MSASAWQPSLRSSAGTPPWRSKNVPSEAERVDPDPCVAALALPLPEMDHYFLLAGIAERRHGAKLPRCCWETGEYKNVGKKEEAKAIETDGIVSRDEFLVGRMLSLQHPLSHVPGAYSLRTEHSANVSPLIRPAPPPGLELPEHLELAPSDESSANKESTPICQAPQAKSTPTPATEMPEVKEYKVILQNMPEAMLKEHMLRAMVEQANLKDIIGLKIRNGKVLITFKSYASVHKCISHFNGRQWGSSAPVVALYVYTASQVRLHRKQAAAAPAAATKATGLKADAPAFVRGSLKADAPSFVPGLLSANALALVPSAEKTHVFRTCLQRMLRKRNCSRWSVSTGASTDVGTVQDGASDVCDSEYSETRMKAVYT